MVLQFPVTVAYMQRRQSSPFTLRKTQNGYWQIINKFGEFVWWAPSTGNSKQRRQQRKKLLKDLNS